MSTYLSQLSPRRAVEHRRGQRSFLREAQYFRLPLPERDGGHHHQGLASAHLSRLLGAASAAGPSATATATAGGGGKVGGYWVSLLKWQETTPRVLIIMCYKCSRH
jgi:hypothetical protein